MILNQINKHRIDKLLFQLCWLKPRASALISIVINVIDISVIIIIISSSSSSNYYEL